MAEAVTTRLRVGIGHDTHRLTLGGPLRLGGIDIPHDHQLVGHSDADVLLHAVTDAVLGAAGLLRGKRATTHWAYTDLLPLVGATYEKARVVRDGNLITAGGVTAGIDFGLVLVAEIAGREAAETVQLSIEYDPAPPLDAGHPDRAPTPVRTALVDRYAKSVQAYRDAIALVRPAA